MAIIECKDLSIGYDNKVVLKDINFIVEEADYLCIIGENGVGKTTLMKTLLNLIKPISGKIFFSENKKVAYLPQQNDIQKDFPASVEEVIMTAFQARQKSKPFYTKEEKDIAKEKMESLQISQIAKKSFRELSGGQKQRVLLARALCVNSDVLLLDEPSSGLDINAKNEMKKILSKLNKEGIAIIIISHDIENILDDVKHILHINKNIFYGNVQEYKSYQNKNI